MAKYSTQSLSFIDKREAQIPVWVRAREHTQAAIACLAGIMHDESAPPGVRALCADKLLDRAYGKAPILVAGDDSRPIRVEVSHLGDAKLAQLESLLMAALGQGISEAIAAPSDPASHPPQLPSPSPLACPTDQRDACGEITNVVGLSDGEDNCGSDTLRED